MVVRIMTDDKFDGKLVDFNETLGGSMPEPPEYDFFGTCPRSLWGRNPVYNPKTNEWEATE